MDLNTGPTFFASKKQKSIVFYVMNTVPFGSNMLNLAPIPQTAGPTNQTSRTKKSTATIKGKFTMNDAVHSLLEGVTAKTLLESEVLAQIAQCYSKWLGQKL